MTPISLLIDGKTADKSASISANDPALTLGLSAFETLRTWGNQPLLLALHHARLRHSAARLQIPAPPLSLLQEEIALLLKDWPPSTDAAVRITLTGGGRRILMARPAPTPHPVLSCVTRPWAPIHGLETVKNGSRAGWVVQVRDSGADDIIMVDGDGLILEATCGAVLALCSDGLVSPPNDGRILPSVTVRILSALAPIARRPIPLDAVQALWICSSLKLFAPVVSLDGRPMVIAQGVHDDLLSRFAEASLSAVSAALI